MEHIDPLDDPDRANPLTAELESDESEPNLAREAAIRALDFMKSAERIIMEYKGDPRFARECYRAAMGWWTLLDVKDQTSLALKWKCSKANVTKLVKKFQGPGFLNLPPMPGQRGLAGCKVMVEARIKQLK